jgi:membrane protease YdiL (CAAX protease family)
LGVYVNRFWSSVGGVALYLLGIGLLQYLLVIVGTLFGLLPGGLVRTTIIELIAIGAPVIGTLTYINWKWAWKAEHIGAVRSSAGAVWLVIGLMIGMVAAVVAYLLSALFSGGAIPFAVPPFAAFGFIAFFRTLALAFGIELVFRGAVISRYQADLPYKELLIAALLTPFAWALIAGFFILPGPLTGIGNLWLVALSLFLTLLFLRTDSVWLSAGLRAGMVGMVAALPLQISDTGGLAVWGTAAAILLFQEWRKLQGQPQRVAPRRGPQPPGRGRTIRGPWGPH